jgi:hypothetical protein
MHHATRCRKAVSSASLRGSRKTGSAFWTSMFTKLMPLQVGGDPNSSPVQVIIETGFAYDDDPGANKSIVNAAALA